MWKLKESAENLLKPKEKPEGCRDSVSGMLKLEVGLAAPGLESTCDIVRVPQ